VQENIGGIIMTTQELIKAVDDDYKELKARRAKTEKMIFDILYSNMDRRRRISANRERIEPIEPLDLDNFGE
jgi:ribosomal protein L20A (L18A)